MATTAHGTLTANEVTTHSITPGRGGVVVVNRDAQGMIWARIDGEDPVPYADGTYIVLGAREFDVNSRGLYGPAPLTVKLLSDAARAYSVEAVQ